MVVGSSRLIVPPLICSVCRLKRDTSCCRLTFLLSMLLWYLLSSLLIAYYLDFPQLLAPRVESKSKLHLSKMLEGIIKDGGEGVILRMHHSVYEHGRSNLLWKLKVPNGLLNYLRNTRRLLEETQRR